MRLFYSTIVLSCIVLTNVVAQGKLKKVFTLPPNISANDYEAGVVWVKVKDNQRSRFKSQQAGVRISNVQLNHIKPLVPEHFANKVKARRAPRASSSSSIDLSLYYRLSVDPQDKIEDVINKLYSTGYFEIVEPSYKYYQSHVPNDPSVLSQYYLDKINAFEAWDISKSTASVVIAIIDSGGDLDHPDLASKLFINVNEIPNNGIDDDGNNFTDDVNGWDFSGAQQSLIGTPGFVGDNNPSVTKGGTHSHGTMVAGCAAGATNNNTGIAGVGYNARLLFTKHYADDQATDSRNYSSNLYAGIIYAADVLTDNNIDMKIINCSFGGGGRSQVVQDIINFITLDLNCLVIAAAGNESSEVLSYPAAYDHVLSVASTDMADRRSSFSNYGTWVDISAPGSSILTTSFNDLYESVNGTSFACPVTSGAAALVWSNNPSLTATQVAEILRVSADDSFYSLNAVYNHKLGKGRLDVHKALTVEYPSLRSSNIKLQNGNGSSAVRANQTAYLSFDVFNHLSATSANAEISISSNSPLISFSKASIFPGVINSNSNISLKNTPFVFSTGASIPQNSSANLLITYSDGDYLDYEMITVNLNPSYIDIEENQISTTVSSVGRVGYDGDGQTKGIGYQFNGTPLLYEMGLVMGNSSGTILNTVRGSSSGAYDQDFVEIERIDQIIPGLRSASEIFGLISNSATPASQSMKIQYRSMVWRDAPNDKFIIMEYKLTNPTATAINNYHIGLFADWDIAAGDGANWNAAKSIGYVFPKTDVALPLAGIQVLTGSGSAFSIDNNQATAGTPFGLYDGFTDAEKFTSISNSRAESGVASEGGDVSHVVSSGPHTINPGQTITVAFAIHAAADLTALLESATAANTMYNLTLTAPTPVVQEVETCYGNTASITATGASNFNWYHDFTDGEPFHSGNQLVTDELYNDTIVYVSNADNAYESVRTMAVVNVKAVPQIISSGPTAICENKNVTLTAQEADEYEWSNGATSQSIEVSAAGEFSVIVRDHDLSCESQSAIISVTTYPLPVAGFSSGTESISDTPIKFKDESTGAVAWDWDFGDGQSSTQQNPTHIFTDGGEYDVILTVTSVNGCENSITKGIGVITSTEKELEAAVKVYPNPAKGSIKVEASGLSSPYFTIQLMSIQGQSLYRATQMAENGKMSHLISGTDLPVGLYIVKITNEGKTVVRKILRRE